MNMLVQGSGLSKLLSRGEVLFNACPGVSMNCVQGCKNFCHQRGCTHINWNSPIGILVFFVAHSKNQIAALANNLVTVVA